MLISMWMLYDAIAGYAVHHNLDDSAKERISVGVRPYIPGGEFAREYIYVSAADSIAAQDIIDGGMFVICGEKVDYPSIESTQYIHLMPGIGYLDALSITLAAFEKYSTWYDKLQMELIGTSDLTRLCEIGTELLENGISLFNNRHELIAYASLPENFFEGFIERKGGQYYTLTDSACEALMSVSNHWSDSQSLRAAISYDPNHEIRYLYANLGPGKSEYRLCVGEDRRELRESDGQICEVLAETLYHAMDGNHTNIISERTEVIACLRHLISGNSELNYSSLMKIWQENSKYCCLVLEKNDPDGEFVPPDQYVCRRIEELLMDAISFMSNGKIICVERLFPDYTHKQIIEKLEKSISGSGTLVGISGEFSDIRKLREYYKEAELAASYAQSDREGKWFRYFPDCAHEHFFKCGSSLLPSYHYIDQNARKLMEVTGSKIDYVETLRVYLENERNLLNTAQKLHIHRTTLFYRLRRIHEFIDCDLDDPTVRFSLMLSFKLIGESEIQ